MLGENYRCAPDIVQQSAHVISYNQGRFEKPIRPAKIDVTHQEAVRIITCPSLTAEPAALVHTIRQWIGTGYKYADIAVLVRVKSIAGLVQMILKEHSIPFLPLGNEVLYTSDRAGHRGVSRHLSPTRTGLSGIIRCRPVGADPISVGTHVGHRVFR